MLHVEVFIPTLQKEYEFSLNEHSRVSALIDEIISVISVKEQKKWENDGQGMILCDAITAGILPAEKTLHQCRVRSGARLVLV